MRSHQPSGRRRQFSLGGRPGVLAGPQYLEGSAERVAYAGSLRRMKEIVHDVDLPGARETLSLPGVFLSVV